MYTIAMPSMWEWLIIVAVLLLLFGGGRKIPELARSLGSSITEFKKGLHDTDGKGDAKPKASLQEGERKDRE
jgi:TatA/E family protein of Tat protein translocase